MSQSTFVSQVSSQIRDVSFTTTIPIVIVTIITVLLTRYITGFDLTNSNLKGAPPRIPYWIPILANLPSYLLGPTSFLEHCKDICPQGIFSVLLGPISKTVVYSPILIEQLESTEEPVTDPLSSQIRMLQHGWGLSSRHIKEAESVFSDVFAELQNIFERDGPQILNAAIRKLEQKMTSLVTFADSPIDLEYWERMSGTVLLDDDETVETNLITLIQTFLTFFTSEFLLAEDLLEQQPPLVPLLMVFPSHLENLLLRPRAFSPRSHAIIRTILINVQPFLEAVFPHNRKPNAIYTGVEDLNTPFLSVLRIPSIQSAPFNVQCSIFIYLLSLSIIPHTIVPWAILELLTPSSSLHVYEKEINEIVTKKVSITQDPGIGVIVPPPDVHINVGMSSTISTLIADTTLKYSRGWSEYSIGKDIVLKDTDTSSFSKREWHIKKGDQVIVAHWLSGESSTSPNEDKQNEAVDKALQKLGAFQDPGLSSLLAALYPAFIAAFMKLYEIEPIAKSGWHVPTAKSALGVALATEDVRVRIRKRRLDKQS